MFKYADDNGIYDEAFDQSILGLVRQSLRLLLNFRLEGPDNVVVARQRIAGMYGPPGDVEFAFTPIRAPGTEA